MATLDLFFRIDFSTPGPHPIEENGAVINLSSYLQLTNIQTQLLKKGLSFVPTCKVSKKKRESMDINLKQYHRRLKLDSFFGPSEPGPLPPFMPPSLWEPDDRKLPFELLTLIREDKETVSHSQDQIDPDNLTPDEFKALKALTKDTSIIIKPADKGSSTVIMDRQITLKRP